MRPELSMSVRILRVFDRLPDIARKLGPRSNGAICARYGAATWRLIKDSIQGPSGRIRHAIQRMERDGAIHKGCWNDVEIYWLPSTPTPPLDRTSKEVWNQIIADAHTTSDDRPTPPNPFRPRRPVIFNFKGVRYHRRQHLNDDGIWDDPDRWGDMHDWMDND